MQRPPCPEWIKSVIKADKKSKCLSITLTVLKNTFGKDIIIKAIIDSGSLINCLNWGFVKRHNLPHYHLPTPICTKNIDGSYNKAGTIKFITTLFIRMKGIVHQVLFHITNCGNKNVILGDPWLEKTNPLINWQKHTVDIPNHTDHTPDFNQKNEIVQGTSTTTPHANLLPSHSSVTFTGY